MTLTAHRTGAPRREPPRRARRARGFTIIELMVAITIGIAIVGYAVPSFRTVFLNNRLTSISNDLLASLQTARGEAVKRNARVVVCATADSTVAVPQCTTGAAASWIVFQDTNGNGQLDANEPLIEAHPMVDSAVFLRPNGNQAVAFAPTGFPVTGAGGMGNMVICDSRGVQNTGTAQTTARVVAVSTVGHSRVYNSYTVVAAALAASGLSCP